jgi:hypothetical protein
MAELVVLKGSTERARSIIRALEDKLVQAKRGEINALCIGTVYSSGHIEAAVHPKPGPEAADRANLLGVTVMMQHALADGTKVEHRDF